MGSPKHSQWFPSFCLLVSAIAFVQSSPPNYRFFSGQDAVEGQFPYFASVQVEESQNCGGSILNDHWILTAAHCIKKGKEHSVRVGSVELNKGKRYSVSKYIVHKGYTAGETAFDIALMKTEEKIEFNAKVQPIKLHRSIVGVESVVACGFGRTEEGFPTHLKFVELRSLVENSCGHDEGLICTFTQPGQGVCSGDSGGPLVLNGELVGVAAFVLNGCGLGLPDGFTRVSFYLDWIERNMK